MGMCFCLSFFLFRVFIHSSPFNAVVIPFHMPKCTLIINLFPLVITNFSCLFMYFFVHYRPSAIPGPAPDELVVPATESIG